MKTYKFTYPGLRSDEFDDSTVNEIIDFGE